MLARVGTERGIAHVQEEAGPGCLVVANIDNDPAGQGERLQAPHVLMLAHLMMWCDAPP